jgi:hypothetical protein
LRDPNSSNIPLLAGRYVLFRSHLSDTHTCISGAAQQALDKNLDAFLLGNVSLTQATFHYLCG